MTTLRAKTPSARSRASKSRSKQDERDVARILGGTRHLADSGGPEDVLHELYAIQVKGGLAVVTTAMREGLASARAAAANNAKLPAVVLVDRKGGRIQRWMCFPLEEYADYHGHGR